MKKYLFILLAVSLAYTSLSGLFIVSGTINAGEAVKIETCNKDGWCKLSYTNFYIKEKYLLKLEEEGVYIIDNDASEIVYTYELVNDKEETKNVASAEGKTIINDLTIKNKQLPKVRLETDEEKQERENISKLVGILKFSTLVQVKKCDKFGWCQLEDGGYYVRRDNLKALDVENIYMVDTEDTRMYKVIPKDVNSYNNLGDLKIVRLYKVEDERKKKNINRNKQKDYWFGFDIGTGFSKIASRVNPDGNDPDEYVLNEEAKNIDGGTKFTFDAGYTLGATYSVSASFESMSYGTLGTLNNFAVTGYYRNRFNNKLVLNTGFLVGASYLRWTKELGITGSSSPTLSSQQFHSGVDVQLNYSLDYNIEVYSSLKVYFTKHTSSSTVSSTGAEYTTSPPIMLSLGTRYFF
jgi:DNA-directed RNA polymerase subunit H (RpoH/RPB5)